MSINSIKKKRLSEYIIDELRAFITRNNLKEGDKLPAEKELAEKLQTSKGSLREALRMLEIAGLVNVIPGKGIFVRNSTGDLIVPLPAWITSNKKEISKHFEARLIIEPEIAALAAQRISKKQIRTIEQNILRQEGCVQDDIVSMINADIEFHRLVAEAAGNETLSMLMNSLSRLSFHGWKAALRVKNRNSTAVREHRHIMDCLTEHDDTAARASMREHMLTSIQLLKKQGLNSYE